MCSLVFVSRVRERKRERLGKITKQTRKCLEILWREIACETRVKKRYCLRAFYHTELVVVRKSYVPPCAEAIVVSAPEQII